MSTRGRPAGGPAAREPERSIAPASRPLALEPGVDVALAEPPLASHPDGRNLPGLDQPVDRAEVDLEVFEYLFGRQKPFFHH